MKMSIKSKDFWSKYGNRLMHFSLVLILMLIVPHVFAGSAQANYLSGAEEMVQSEASNDIPRLLGWVCFGLGSVFAVFKMNLQVVVTMFGIFLLLVLGPGVVENFFPAAG